jgi:hypothetical protein
MKKRMAALFGLGMVLASTGAALAQSVPAVFRDGQNNVYVTGVSSNAKVEMTYQSLTRSRDYQSNSCGWILLRPSAVTPIPASMNAVGTAITAMTLS